MTTLSYSTAISASSRITASSTSETNFNGNGILRDDDGNGIVIGNGNHDIGFRATAKNHKKQINGMNDGLNANTPNDNDAYSMHNIASNMDKLNEFDDDNETDDESSDFLSIEIDDQLSLKDQMLMLTQQMTKRFKHELKAAVRKTTKDLFKADFQAQLEQLR